MYYCSIFHQFYCGFDPFWSFRDHHPNLWEISNVREMRQHQKSAAIVQNPREMVRPSPLLHALSGVTIIGNGVVFLKIFSLVLIFGVTFSSQQNLFISLATTQKWICKRMS